MKSFQIEKYKIVLTRIEWSKILSISFTKIITQLENAWFILEINKMLLMFLK